MLCDPKRLRTPNSYGYLVSWKHRLRIHDEVRAAAMVDRLLADPSNVAALRAGIGRPDATEDDLAQWLVTGLAGGGLLLLKTKVRAPVMDSPPETDLFDLLPPEEPQRELESLTFEVVDNKGQGVAARYKVLAASGEPAGVLAANDRRFIGDLEPDADVQLELSALVLPLREHIDEDEHEHEAEAHQPQEPAPLGPDATEPDPPAPLGPDGVEPENARFKLLRAAPTPLEVSGALALPDGTPEPSHFVPVVLSALAAARSLRAPTIWGVGLDRSLASSQLASVEAVIRGRRAAWVELAAHDGSLEEICGYFGHLSAHRGWSIPTENGFAAQVEAFQAAYNTRFGAAILEDGVCGTQTLGAVFDVLTDELARWLPSFGLDHSGVQTAAIQFVPASPAGPRLPTATGLDVWIFDEAELPGPANLELLYEDPRADVAPVHVPWSFEADAFVVRLRAESAEDLRGYIGVRLERSDDGSLQIDVPIIPGDPVQDVWFDQIPTDGRYCVSLVREDGSREILAADQPFIAFLDDRKGRE